MKTPLRILTRSTIAAVLALAAAIPAHAASRTIDPQALALLQRMSDSLSSAKAFTFRADTIVELPALTGQFITVFSKAEVTLRRPDGLRVLMTGEAPHFDFFYDGRTVTAYAPGTRLYSVKNAPPTLEEMLRGLQAETGIRFAMAPFLFQDAYRVFTHGIKSAVIVGITSIRGSKCDHLAFRSPGVNWEIWIDSSGSHLPRRLAVTFTDRPNFPRTLVEFTSWNLHPCLWGDPFRFRKPLGAHEIPFDKILKSSSR